MREVGTAAIAAFLLLIFSAAASAAQPDPLALWDRRAQALMNDGRIAEAAAILDARLAQDPNDVQARFLKGMISISQGDHQQAIRIFRSILIDQPKATRVRLELARAFYLDNDYGNAMRQFQFALAANPPDEVAANIRRYMAAIRDAKDFSYKFTASIAPDTNISGGSSAREITLFGLPFDLSDDARKRSGFGLALEGGGEWLPRIGAAKRLRIGLNVQRREYSGSDFDDTILAAYAGPRIVSGKWDISLLGTAYRRWYGTRPYNRAAGARVEATYHATPRLDLTQALGLQFVRYDRQPHRNGPLVFASASAFYALTPISAVTLRGGVSREDAREDAFSNWSGFVAAGYFRELPMGFSAYVEPSLSRARYDRALLAFGRTRHDTTRSVSITLLNRHIVLDRFTPRISYTYTRQNSSIPLHDFKRNRLEVGLTTTF